MTSPDGQPQEIDFVELAIAGIDLGPEDAQPAVGTIQLIDVESGNRLDIVMARNDALAVQQAVASQDPPRPRTHDLVLAAIEALGGRVSAARILDRQTGGVFVAELLLFTQQGDEVRLDARPSDALNVALRSGAASVQANSALLAPALN